MNVDEHYVCNYALLRYLPFPETEEFINRGVVVCDAQTGRLTSRIEMVKEKRVTDFFPGLDLAAFRFARSITAAEIQRMEQLASAPDLGAGGRRDRGRELFLELVRPREGVFRFGEIRTILTPNPEGVADELFERYVEQVRRTAGASRPA
jgi:hypothetical protein